nr:fimbria/pilus periplasmic chaperone [Xanthomonas theicola]
MAPVLSQIDADSAQTVVWFYNHSHAPWQAEARLYRWQQHDNQDLLEPASDVALSPRLIDIPAGGRQLLRLRLGPVPASRENAYRLVVEERATPGDTALLRYSAPVFVQPERPATTPPLAARLAGDDARPVLLIHNAGNRHARIADLTFFDAQGRHHPIADSLAGYVLAGQSRQWRLLGVADAFRDGHFVARIDSQPERRLDLGD